MDVKKNALLVEDDDDILDLMKIQLMNEQLNVTAFQDGESALRFIETTDQLDILVIDWMLPGISGIDLVKKVREQNITIPIIMVTALNKTEDIVKGLEMGADDYICKPFDLREFRARVRTYLRKSPSKAEASRIFKSGNISLDPSRVKVSVSGTEVHLTQSEYGILKELMERPGHVFTRKQLYQSIQGPDIHASERTIDTHMAGLRKKLGQDGNFIETIRGIGYRMMDDDL
jgi:DNA-binding response OmpR family regulator